MGTAPDNRKAGTARIVSRIFATVVFLTGLVVLAGWVLDVPALKSVHPSLVTMKANTALCFALIGVSLWLLQGGGAGGAGLWVERGLAFLAALIGLLTLVEYGSGLNLGIDQLLFREGAGAVATSQPGRMAPNTAVCFLAIGTALLLLDVKAGAGFWISEVLVHLAGLIGMTGLVGYIYGVTELTGLAACTKMAVHTAAAFVVAYVGLVAARPDRGLAKMLACDCPGGMVMRRLLPLTVVLFVFLGWLRLEGERRGLYPTALGTALRVMVDLVVMAAIIIFTARKLHELEARRREAGARVAGLAAIVESSDDAIIGKTLDGVITEWNRGAERLYGYSAGEAVGRNVAMLLPPDRAGEVAGMVERLMRGEDVEHFETLRRRKDGTLACVALTISLVRDHSGKVTGASTIARDITRRKQAEQVIERLNEDLKRRGAELEVANKELEAFSYSVSHDLRAPLRAMDGFSQALVEDYGGKLDDQGRDYLGRVRAASQKMAQLIDDLLNLSRVSRTEMHRGELDLSALGREIVEELRNAEPARQVEVAIAPGLTASGDARLLRVALVNLLGNAWKFTRKKPRARIEFGTVRNAELGTRKAELANEATAYFVRDDGAGFDMSYANKLFGAFQRLHSSQEFEGAGIGLATVQRIIRRHGGKVWAESAVAKGATFYFTLPIAEGGMRGSKAP